MRTELDVFVDDCRARMDALFDQSLKSRLIRMRMRMRCSRPGLVSSEQDDFLRGDLLGRGMLKRNVLSEQIARAHWRHSTELVDAWEAAVQTKAEKSELLQAVQELESTLQIAKARWDEECELELEVTAEPETFLEELFADSLFNLLKLAEASTTPGNILEQLAAHPSARVRSAIVENCNAPLDSLLILTRDEDADIRYLIAENHNLPAEVISALTEDDNPYVACRAQKTLKRLTGGQSIEVIEGRFAERARPAQARVSIARA